MEKTLSSCGGETDYIESDFFRNSVWFFSVFLYNVAWNAANNALLKFIKFMSSQND